MFELKICAPVNANLTPPKHVLQCLAWIHAALLNDKHIRMAYYPIFVGSAAAANGSSPEQQAAFYQNFNTFILNHLPNVHLVERDNRAFINRPEDEANAAIRCNRWLAVALEAACENLEYHMWSVQLVFIMTILHDLGHAYAWYLRGAHYKPEEVNLRVGEDSVPARDGEGRFLQSQDGKPMQACIDEAGYMVEEKILGDSFKISAVYKAKAQHPWRSVCGATVENASGAAFDIIPQVAHDWLTSFISCQSGPLPINDLQSGVPDAGYARLRVFDALGSQCPNDSPTKSGRSRERLAAIDVTGTISSRTWPSSDV